MGREGINCCTRGCLSFILLYCMQVIQRTGRSGHQLVTDEPVEFEKQLAQFQDFGEITDPFKGVYKIFLKLKKKYQPNPWPFRQATVQNGIDLIWISSFLGERRLPHVFSTPNFGTAFLFFPVEHITFLMMFPPSFAQSFPCLVALHLRGWLLKIIPK